MAVRRRSMLAQVEIWVGATNALNFSLVHHLDHSLITRMTAQCIEIRILFHPCPSLGSASLDRTFQQIESFLYLAQFGVPTSHIVLSQRIIRIDRECSGDPIARPIGFADFNQG